MGASEPPDPGNWKANVGASDPPDPGNWKAEVGASVPAVPGILNPGESPGPGSGCWLPGKEKEGGPPPSFDVGSGLAGIPVSEKAEPSEIRPESWVGGASKGESPGPPVVRFKRASQASEEAEPSGAF